MPDADQALGLMERQRLQQHAVHHAEDRRIGADPQREREGGQRREAGLLPQHARGVAQILPEIGEQKPVGAPGVIGGGTCA